MGQYHRDGTVPPGTGRCCWDGTGPLGGDGAAGDKKVPPGMGWVHKGWDAAIRDGTVPPATAPGSAELTRWEPQLSGHQCLPAGLPMRCPLPGGVPTPPPPSAPRQDFHQGGAGGAADHRERAGGHPQVLRGRGGDGRGPPAIGDPQGGGRGTQPRHPSPRSPPHRRAGPTWACPRCATSSSSARRGSSSTSTSCWTSAPTRRTR